MTINILIVDDSSFFQRQLKNIINEHPELKVIGVADNGREAVEKVKKLKPDIVTMDYEMPMMDGVTAVRTIMAENPLPIMMLSSMTYEGARTTLDALEAGAVDFMTKNFSEIANNSPAIKKRIYDALLAISSKIDKSSNEKNNVISLNKSSSEKVSRPEVAKLAPKVAAAPVKTSQPKSTARPKIVLIGASTGGPAALTELLKGLPVSFNLPILIIQHMPENFTRAFAERLDRQCAISVKEAETGDDIKPGRVLLAPGGKQMIVDTKNTKKVKIIDGSDEVNYTPCVDITFASVSNVYGGETLALVMTGMGHDGRDGAKLLSQKGATIWTQAKDDCLIYGMPMAVDQANLSDASYKILELQQKLISL
ncbi:MAG: protein-glutamate methylesterase/protein-glutamine glutaminase [Cellvibrionaceae bacterium]